jgi:hypothetical protein
MSLADLRLAVFAPSSHDRVRAEQPAAPAWNILPAVNPRKRLAQAEEAFVLFRKVADFKRKQRRMRATRICVSAALIVASNLALAAIVTESVLLF